MFLTIGLIVLGWFASALALGILVGKSIARANSVFAGFPDVDDTDESAQGGLKSLHDALGTRVNPNVSPEVSRIESEITRSSRGR